MQLRDVGIRFEGQSPQALRRIFRVFGSHGRRATPDQSYTIDALKGISLDIRSGERVGLIGLNGAGKSTLLKVMAGIYPPTTGTVAVNGHVCPMFEFATGFEMEQSGWDNIRIRGMLLGMAPDEIEAKLPSIAEFTELGEFLDYPVRTYSSGMFIRLAFAVSTSINPEILLIDEVMGAGDAAFAEKARRRMFEFMEQGRILVFTTHNTQLLKGFCQRTLWLRKGEIVADGPTAEITAAYASANQGSNGVGQPKAGASN